MNPRDYSWEKISVACKGLVLNEQPRADSGWGGGCLQVIGSELGTQSEFGLGRVACKGLVLNEQPRADLGLGRGRLAGDLFWGLELRASLGLVGVACE